MASLVPLRALDRYHAAIGRPKGWSAAASPDNGAYGLYPIGSHGVRIERCVVYGARDAGIYVGQSTNALVVDSEAYGNVAGIEIENTTDVEVRDNAVHDNTAGILVFNLPNLPVQDGKRAKVHENRVENGAATFINADLCDETPEPSQDIGAVTCEHEPLPPQDP